MLPKYQENFAALDQSCAGLLASALIRRFPDLQSVEPSNLYEICEQQNLDHADVVMSLANDPTPLAVRTLETLIGKPIERGAPCLKVNPKKPAATLNRPQSDKTTRSPRPSPNDPRIISFVAPNPKKPGSAAYDRYALYRVGMSVNEALAAGIKREDIAWDSAASRQFIKF
jgi:hypothetical protein